MAMEKLVIGSPNVPIPRVVELLSSSSVSQYLFQYLADVSRTMKVPDAEWEPIGQSLLHKKIENTEALNRVLVAWKASFGKNAHLKELIRVLQQHGLHDLAEKLQLEFEKFAPPETNPQRKMRDGTETGTFCGCC